MKKLNNRRLRMESLEGRQMMTTLAIPVTALVSPPALVANDVTRSTISMVALVANDETMSGANNLGTINGWKTQTGTVSGTDRVDFYKFQVGANGQTKIDLSGMSRDIDIQVLDSSGRVLASGSKGGTAAESVSLNLTAGATYYVKVFPYASGGSTSNYTLRIESLSGNDSRATAIYFGNVAGGQTKTLKSGLGGSGDPVDYFRFDVGPVPAFGLWEGTRRVTITLSELNGDADIEILDRSGNVIGSSRRGGTNNDSVTLDLINGRDYFVKVTPFNGALTDYRLTISATR